MNTASTSTSLLKNKHAVIFGASGAVGTAVAKEFAAQGAIVFLSGRTLNAVEQVAQEIHQDGGVAYAAQVDALDEQAVQAYLDGVAQEGGSIDILLNVMGPQPKDYGNGTNTLELPFEQFLLPLSTLVPSQFITARAAARHMVRQRSGVILFVTAGLDMTKTPNVTAIGAAFGASKIFERAIVLRETIYRIFFAVAHATLPERADLDALQAAFAEAMLHASLVPTAEGFTCEWLKREDALDCMLWPIASSAVELLTSVRVKRVKECPGVGDCGWLFLDTSKNGSRLWCSMEDCGSRAKMRRQYARKRASR